MFVQIRDSRFQTICIALGMVLFSFPLGAQTEPIDRVSELPTPDEQGDYQPTFPIHPTWEIVDRGLSGLNCYETFPPNQGSHRVVSRLFSRQFLEAIESDEETAAWVESRGRTWLAVRDPWSGQSCWVRANADFIKPIAVDGDSIEKSLGV
ncbi:MAG: hypothetical protein WBB29_02270 [Geitlerinemataceae cyanobacterium]